MGNKAYIQSHDQTVCNNLPETKTTIFPVRRAILLTVIVCTTRVQSCQDVDIFTHHSRSCYKSEHGESCTIDTTEIMKINPFKQEACIQLRSKETNVIEIKLIWKGLDLICEKQTTVFTRSTKYALLDSKRCPHAGSCTGEKCGKVNRTFKVPELHRANHFPGITDCVESCGGPGCDCFYPSSGCLFYRIYLVPNDEKVYEFFKCNRWKQRVNLQLTVIEADESEQEYNFYVLPNQPKRILPFIVTLSSISTPPTPMLHSTFLTDGSRYAIAPTNFQPPLVCASQDDAMNLTCEVREECECTPAEVRMKCDCKEVNLTTHIREPQYTLPVIRPNLEFRAVNGTIISKIPQLPTAEFILRIKGRFNTTSMKSDAICTSDNTHCTGCYKCAKGARALLTCRSTTPTMAEIQCGDDAFTVPCNNTGVQTKISFISNKALFYRECTIKCGTTRNSFKITGLLHYTGSLQGAARRILEGESEVYSEINLPDFEHLARTFLTWWTTLAVTALIVVVALLVTYLAITNAFLCTVMTTILRILTTLFRLALYLLRVLGVLLFRCLCSHLIKKKEI